MKKDMGKQTGRKLWKRFSTVAFAAVLCAAMAGPVLADDTAGQAQSAASSVSESTSGTITLTLEDAKGNVTKTVTYDPAKDGAPRSTYYDAETGRDYDYVSGSNSTTAVPDAGATSLTYKEHVAGSGSEKTDSYYVTVNYVTEDGTKTIRSTGFYVNGKDHIFYAPKIFSVVSGGRTIYYSAVDDTKIEHKVSDSTVVYNLKYHEETSSDAYTWYIMLYDSETNTCIDVKTVDVAADGTASYTPEKTITVNGKKYTVNKKFDTTLKQSFSSGTRTSYVYYDPEGYENSSEIKTKTISIQYVDIANGSVLGTATAQATSEKDTEITFPDSFDKDGVSYIKVDGQVSRVEHSFYSPKTLYTVYYRDVNNTDFENVVITTEEVQEVTVSNGQTVYTVVPGITRYVATNTTTGVSNVLQTTGADGEAINTGSNDTVSGGTADDSGDGDGTSASSSGSTVAGDDGQDVTIDGVQADEIQTPQSNIRLNEKTSSAPAAAIVIGCILAAAAVALILLLIVRTRRTRAKSH